MQNGFIVILAQKLIDALQRISLVERLKSFGEKRFVSKNADADKLKIRSHINLWIDGFMLAKWGVVALFFLLGVSGWVPLIVVCYLLFFNLFSYFYYHAWDVRASETGNDEAAKLVELERTRRRFINLLLAISFSFLGFAYLYVFQFSAHFEWPAAPGRLDGIYLSVFNSFTLTYDGFQPCDAVARAVLLAQVLNVFVFFTVLLGNTIPNVNEGG